MLFTIDLNREEYKLLLDVFRQSQDEIAGYIRVLNRVMRACFGDKDDYSGAFENIKFYNERQKLLRKLTAVAGDYFTAILQPDDLKLWEELSLEKRGLADPIEKEEKEGEGRLIVADIAAWKTKSNTEDK